ncbi:MAG: sel1 repeat family protein [Betaproteobacteria bacterium]|nr:sel1 repeat family protein [Betaproteobacteria bacterium]
MQQANAGNPVAEYNLAGAYFHGKGGLPRDPAKAVYWFKKSAAQGYPRAEYSLGIAYYQGRDPAKAMYWFKKSAAQGYPLAESNLGVAYYQGVGGLPRDPAKAVYWCKKSAAQGYQPAIAALHAIAAPPAQPSPQPARRAAEPLADNQQTLQNLQRFWTLYFQASNAQVVDFGEPALVRPVSFGDMP